MIKGMKISVATSISCSVSWLDTLSHTVRLEAGWLDEGITKGNMLIPAVPITPASPTASPEGGKTAATTQQQHGGNAAQIAGGRQQHGQGQRW
jgi:hypothetical protein